MAAPVASACPSAAATVTAAHPACFAATTGGTIANFSYHSLTPPDAVLLASDLSKAGVSGSLTAADLRNNALDDASKKMLRDSVKDRAGFKLEL